MNQDSTKDDFLEGVLAIFDKSFDAIYQGFKSSKKALNEEEKMKVITDALKSVREDASLKVKVVDQLLANPEKTKELFKEILESNIKSEKQFVVATNKKITDIIKGMSEEFKNEAKEKVAPKIEKAVSDIEKTSEELLEKEVDFKLSKDGLNDKEIMYEVYNYLNEDEMKLFIAAAEKSSEALDNTYADSFDSKSYVKADFYNKLLGQMDEVTIEKVERVYTSVVENSLQTETTNKIHMDRVPSLEKLKEWVSEIEKQTEGLLEKEDGFKLEGLTDKEIIREIYDYLNEDEMKLFVVKSEITNEELDNSYADSYKQLLEKMDKSSIEKVERVYNSLAGNELITEVIVEVEKEVEKSGSIAAIWMQEKNAKESTNLDNTIEKTKNLIEDEKYLLEENIKPDEAKKDNIIEAEYVEIEMER